MCYLLLSEQTVKYTIENQKDTPAREFFKCKIAALWVCNFTEAQIH